ncbi:MAG: ABC transporter permease [Bryobacterales bacterium]|nr:ABC transporter permease [Bryobacterales bacterium]
MKFLLAVARKDLLHIVRDPAGLASSIGVPLVLLVLLTSVFGGEKVTPKGKLLISDEDGSLVSRLLTSAFSQGELAEMIETEKVSTADGKRRMDGGEASALLIVPKGLSEAFLDRKPFELTLLKNPSQSILPELVEEVLSVFTEGGYYIQRVLGDELTVFQSRPTDAAIADISVRLRGVGDAVRTLADPPLIDVKMKQPAARQPVKRTSFGGILLPGMLMLSMLFLSQAMCAEIWRERTKGTLRRLAMAPRPLAGWLLGRVLAAMVVLAAIVGITLVGGHFGLGAEYANPVGLFVWCVFSGASIYLAISALQFHASSDRAAATFTNLLVLPLALAGGSMAPLDSLPASIARIGRLTPNGAAVEQMRHLMAGPVGGDLFVVGAALLCLGGAGFALSLRALRRGFAAG